MRRHMRMAALAVSAVLALGTFALAQDWDDYHYRGANAGSDAAVRLRPGLSRREKRGRHEGRENDPYDYHTPDWRQATRGYKNWMGPVNAYQNGYQQGYAGWLPSRLHQRASRMARSGDDRYRGDGYRGEGYRGNGYYGGNYRYDSRVGYNTGYQDGITMAREDQYNRKPFNPNPRARYGGRDNGYVREYGDKNSYKAEYTDGYRAGYQSAFNREILGVSR